MKVRALYQYNFERCFLASGRNMNANRLNERFSATRVAAVCRRSSLLGRADQLPKRHANHVDDRLAVAGRGYAIHLLFGQSNRFRRLGFDITGLATSRAVAIPTAIFFFMLFPFYYVNYGFIKLFYHA